MSGCLWLGHTQTLLSASRPFLPQAESLVLPTEYPTRSVPSALPPPPQPELLGAAFPFLGMQRLAEVLRADS